MNRRQRKNIPIFVMLASIVLIVLVVAIAGGGGGSGAVRPVSDYPPVIPATTKLISASSSQFLTSISPDGVNFTFSQTTTELDSLNAGDIMVSDVTSLAPYGFLRRVTNINRSGGQVIIQTSPAALTDAIQSGTFRIKQKLTPADVIGAAQPEGVSYKLASPVRLQDEFYVEVKDLVIYDYDGNPSTTYDQARATGEITFAPDITFDVAIKDFESIEMVFLIEFTNTSKLELDFGGDWDLDKYQEIARYYIHPITIFIGYVPVVITPLLMVNIGIDGDVSIGTQIDLKRTETYTAGLTYNNGWSPVAKHTERFEHSPIHLMASCDFKGHLSPQVSLLVYGVVGPFADIKGYLQVKADVSEVPWWKFYAGLGVDVGIKSDLLFKGKDYKVEVIGYRIQLDQAETGATPSPGVTGSAMPTLYVVTGSVTPTPFWITGTIPPPSPIVTQTATSPLPPSTNSSTVLILDTSGSMSEPDPNGVEKLQAAIQAGSNLIDIIAAENQAEVSARHQVGIVDFSASAFVDTSLTTDLASAKASLFGLSADGGTAMGSGLQLGLGLLTGNVQGKPIIILLSDGMANIGLNGEDDKSIVRQQILDLAGQAGNQNICIYTVGFGDPSGGGDSRLDEDFLRQVATASVCGTYQNARDSWQLANVYINLRHASTGTTLLNKPGQIAQDQRVEIDTIQVPDNQAMMLFTLNWPGSRLDPVLMDPGGKMVDSNYPGASFSITDIMASIIIQDPLPGKWLVAAQGVEVPEGNTLFNAILSVRAKPFIPPTPQPTPQPPPPQAPALPLAILLLVLAGSGVMVYVLVHTAERRRHPTRAAGGFGPAHLYVLNGNMAGRMITLFDGFVIGRSSKSALRLEDRSVSRQHARLRCANKRWYIQDLGSTSGTLINGFPASASALNPGDRIRIGSIEFEFRS